MSGEETDRMFFNDNRKRSCVKSKSTGHRTDPCGTPNQMGAGSEVWQWMLTD